MIRIIAIEMDQSEPLSSLAAISLETSSRFALVSDLRKLTQIRPLLHAPSWRTMLRAASLRGLQQLDDRWALCKLYTVIIYDAH